MIEGLFQPAHLLLSLLVFAVYIAAPLWFVYYVVTSLRQIKQAVERIAHVVQTNTLNREEE